MTTGSLLLGFALFLVVLLFLARPFLAVRAGQTAVSATPRQQLLAQKDHLLDDIHALDFDHETGKMPTAVYQPQRQQLVEAAAIVLQQLDQLGSNANYQQRDTEIEAAIAKLRQNRTASARFCSQCGHPLDAGDKFCAACGSQISNR
ncbi:MAG: zinc ribbon domain-containing protein [Chloroflexota bacterium]